MCAEYTIGQSPSFPDSSPRSSQKGNNSGFRVQGGKWNLGLTVWEQLIRQDNILGKFGVFASQDSERNCADISWACFNTESSGDFRLGLKTNCILILSFFSC